MTMRILAAAAVLLSVFMAGRPLAQAPGGDTDESRRVRESATVFSEIMAADDSGIPGSVLGRAEAIAVFPGTLKGGFIIGALRGRGIISARTESGWSSPAFLTLTGGSLGLQIGGEAADIVLIIMNRRGLETLVSNQFKLGADAAVAAGPVGRDAQASTDLQLRAQILSYSRARGLFAGVTVNGSTIRQDRDANSRYYGRRLETKEIVLDAGVEPPAAASVWLDALTRYARR